MPRSDLYDPGVQALSPAALAAGRCEAIAALVDRLRRAPSSFYAGRLTTAETRAGDAPLASLTPTTGADFAAEVAAHPPFGRLQTTADHPIRTGLALTAVPEPVPICWTRADLDAEAALGARALRRAGVRARTRTSDCLEGALITPGTLAISDALDHLDALALPVGPLTTDAALDRAREVWELIRPECLIVDAATFIFLDRHPRRPGVTLVPILTPRDADLLRQAPRDDLYRILSLPQIGTFIAGECRAHAGYHVAEDAFVAEVARDDGAPLPDGEVGAVLLTSLQRSTALLRYAIGIPGRLDRAPCGCGETQARIHLG